MGGGHTFTSRRTKEKQKNDDKRNWSKGKEERWAKRQKNPLPCRLVSDVAFVSLLLFCLRRQRRSSSSVCILLRE